MLEDPLFVNPGLFPAGFRAPLGYRLQRGSPCIAAGVPIPDNGGRDFLGQRLPGNRPPSVGAIEWIGPTGRGASPGRRPGAGR